jgi:spore maturation protein CgeB
MTNAVNQRVFDVSACRRFILTDYRSQITEFFKDKQNMVWFEDVGEIPELVKHYLNNEKERDRVSNNAYEIVLKNHTYKNRINKMIDIMKKRYK